MHTYNNYYRSTLEGEAYLNLILILNVIYNSGKKHGHDILVCDHDLNSRDIDCYNNVSVNCSIIYTTPLSTIH